MEFLASNLPILAQLVWVAVLVANGNAGYLIERQMSTSIFSKVFKSSQKFISGLEVTITVNIVGLTGHHRHHAEHVSSFLLWSLIANPPVC